MKLIAVAGIALWVAAVPISAQAMTPAPLPTATGLVTQVALGCGIGRTSVNGVCVARTTVRHVRREVRRCARYQAGVCVR